jgi:hypothetical protein
MSNPVYISLEEDTFRDLVAGKVATVRSQTGQEVRIILSDIGFGRMLTAIANALGSPGAGHRQRLGFPRRAALQSPRMTKPI